MNIIVCELLHELARRGIDIIITQNSSTHEIYYDLNTGMKSHAYLYVDGDVVTVKMRYDREVSLSIDEHRDDLLEQIAIIVSDCGHGRDYANPGWLTLFEECDLTLN